jgi:hypothetical protein
VSLGIVLPELAAFFRTFWMLTWVVVRKRSNSVCLLPSERVMGIPLVQGFLLGMPTNPVPVVCQVRPLAMEDLSDWWFS